MGKTDIKRKEKFFGSFKKRLQNLRHAGFIKEKELTYKIAAAKKK